MLRADAGSRWALWPYREDGSAVPGLDAVVQGAGRVSAAPVVELVSAEQRGVHPCVPAETAIELGFITAAERDEILAAADARSLAAVARVLRRASRMPSRQRRALADAADPERFVRLAQASGLACSLVRPTWTWAIESVAVVLVAGEAAAAQLAWLGRAKSALGVALGRLSYLATDVRTSA